MAIVAYDFSTYGVENPISISGEWETAYGVGVQLADNAGVVNAASNPEGSPHASNITTLVASYGAKQYAEVVIGANWTNGYGIGPACFMSANNAYYIALQSPAGTANNRVRKYVNGVDTNLLWTGATPIVEGDKVGLLVEYDGTISTLSVYLNPTSVDADGFPTDGFVDQIVDGDLSSGQTGLAGYNISNATQSYAASLYTAGATLAVTIDAAPVTVARGETNVAITISNASVTQGNASITFGGQPCVIASYPGASGDLLVSIPSDINLQYSNNTHQFIYTDDNGATATSSIVGFTPEAGHSYINSVNPLWTDNGYMLFGFTGTPDPVTGDQLEIDTATIPSGILNLPEANSEWVLASMPTTNQTTTCYIIRAATGVRSAPWVIEWVIAEDVTLQVQSSVQSHTSNNLDIFQQNVLTITSLVQLQSTINIELTQQNVLSVASSAQMHVSDNLVLSEQAILTIVKAAQDQSSTNLDLTQSHALTIDASAQLQIAEIITLDVPSSAVGYLTAIITITPSLTAEIETLPRS